MEDSMSSVDTARPSWWKDILNGFIAWIITVGSYGAVIGVVAAVLAAVQLSPSGAVAYMVLPVAISIAAGVIGGMKRVA
jgi:hypothetical protein